jgi:energy-coupling factor transporter ATP-binding protein EcfA2
MVGILLLEIGSSIVAGGIVGFTYFQQNGSPTNDAAKIKRIFENARLTVNEDKKMKTPRLHRKVNLTGGTEYVFQLPLGMSFKQVEDHKHVIEDGLNVKHKMPTIELKELLNIRLNKNIINQIKAILSDKRVSKKEIALDFDGMLRIKVYNEPMPEVIEWNDELLKGKGVPIGITRSGVVYHDFDKLPNLLVAGSPGFGKSQFLKMMITALIKKDPKNASFSLIDLKSGTSFARFKDCKQVKRLGRDPDEAKKILKDIQKDMNRKYDQIVDGDFEDVKEAGDKRRHYIVIDEAADIADDKDSMEIVKDIARRGRAAGFRLIYSTQYPTVETVPSQIKRNIVTRLCFIVDSATASSAVLDQSGAEKLPEIEGRAIYKRLKQEIVQCPYMTNSVIKEKIGPHITLKARDGKNEEHPVQTESRKHPFEYEKA